MKPVILIMIVYYVICQPDEEYLPAVPEKCHGSTDLLYRSCCVFPPFFTREVSKECGGALEVLFIDKKNNVTGFRRRAFKECDFWMCVLDRYSLLTRYGDVDDEKYYSHLDLWVGLNPMFADSMIEAKVFCKENVRYFLPLKACEFFHLHGCIRNFLNVVKNCCIFPAFFAHEVAKECGGALEVLFIDQKNNVTGFRRQAFNACEYWLCVLDKYDLLTQNGDVDDDKYYAHLDLWVGINPIFADSMFEAKAFCIENIRNFLPLKPCEFFHLHGCIRNYLNVDCPVTIPTKECDEVKAFYNECREYYHRK